MTSGELSVVCNCATVAPTTGQAVEDFRALELGG